ncbi:hypothetical protein ACVGV4_06955, partial [Enterobacter hormaechei]
CRAGKRSATRRFARWGGGYPAYEHHKKSAPWGAFGFVSVDFLFSPVSFKKNYLATKQPGCIFRWWAYH